MKKIGNYHTMIQSNEADRELYDTMIQSNGTDRKVSYHDLK